MSELIQADPNEKARTIACIRQLQCDHELKREGNVRMQSNLKFCEGMKVLLQDAGTLYYISKQGNWKRDAGSAFDFLEVPQAIDYALRHRLKRVSVVIAGPARYDFKLPTVP